MKLPPINLLVLDTETTGFVPKIHHVIEVAVVKIENGKRSKEVDQLICLPEGAEVPPVVEALTHISTEDLQGQPAFADVMPSLKKLLGKDTVVVGQNIGFDIGMLKGEGWDLSDCAWIDTSMLASLVFPELESYSLGFMSDVLKLNHTPKHRAMGDVNATIELLERCTERLLELPEKDLKIFIEIASRGPVGYAKFFDALPASKKKTRPKWISLSKHKHEPRETMKKVTLEAPKKGTIELIDQPFSPVCIADLAAGLTGTQWLAVKNLDATLRRFVLPKTVTPLRPPEALLSDECKSSFLAQKEFSSDEVLLAMKLSLYEPETKADLPLHGGERQVWTGKLGATRESKEYVSLLKKAMSGPAILTHQELLGLFADPDTALPKNLHVIIDDASMLEDTATNASAWNCYLPSIRAAATGDETLTRCVDLIELWAEKTRSGQDLRYLAPSDLDSRESNDLRRLLDTLVKTKLPASVSTALNHLLLILNPQNLDGRLTFIESQMDGSKAVKSVHENIGEFLEETLYARASTTLLIPKKGVGNLAAILALRSKTSQAKIDLADQNVTLDLPLNVTLDSILSSPSGKQVIVVGSKRMIEDVYVKHAEELEEQGVALIAQGFSGGQGRMQAEFERAASPAFLVVTPWTYETLDLPAGTVSRLVLHTLPFDHPAHAIVSRRAGRYRDPFSDYIVPRVKNRLFRLTRTLVSHSSESPTLTVLDDRLRTKEYGKGIAEYLKSITIAAMPRSGEQGKLF